MQLAKIRRQEERRKNRSRDAKNNELESPIIKILVRKREEVSNLPNT